MWNNEFKVALITKNTKELDKLISQMPQFETLDEMQEAFYLINHAKELLASLKDETAQSMKKIKDTIRYLELTQSNTIQNLDITQ